MRSHTSHTTRLHEGSVCTNEAVRRHSAACMPGRCAGGPGDGHLHGGHCMAASRLCGCQQVGRTLIELTFGHAAVLMLPEGRAGMFVMSLHMLE